MSLKKVEIADSTASPPKKIDFRWNLREEDAAIVISRKKKRETEKERVALGSIEFSPRDESAASLRIRAQREKPFDSGFSRVPTLLVASVTSTFYVRLII